VPVHDISRAILVLRGQRVLLDAQLADLYGVTTSPLHRGMATDRLVAEWFLDSPRVMAALNDELASPQFSTPVEVATVDDNAGADGLARLQSRQEVIREQFTEAFAKGYAAVGISKTADGGKYLLAPWSDF